MFKVQLEANQIKAYVHEKGALLFRCKYVKPKFSPFTEHFVDYEVLQCFPVIVWAAA